MALLLAANVFFSADEWWDTGLRGFRVGRGLGGIPARTLIF